MNNPLQHIYIIMVNTTLPANIGSAARAMMTANLRHLRLVSPKHPIDDTSYAHAKGGGVILDNAQIYDTLDNAIADCQLVLAASARVRHLPRPVVTPMMASRIIDDFVSQHKAADQNTDCPKIAVLFGREDRGLTNDELAFANFHIQIPANPNYPILNVASSIQVIASTLYAHFDQNACFNQQKLDILIRQTWDEPAITKHMEQKLICACVNLMSHLKLTDDNLKDLPNRLARLSSRLQLDQKEYANLMTIIHKLSQDN